MAMGAQEFAGPGSIQKSEQRTPTLREVSAHLSEIGEFAIHFSSLVANGSEIIARPESLEEVKRKVTAEEYAHMARSVVELSALIEEIGVQGGFLDPGLAEVVQLRKP